ncbi:MAG: LytTR family transcriptional regulator [Clostridioides sp.]|jgi:DNA-binding LytR/AlgR family response regulator|nr:LytTR family transcriptional regulator [Clostridioides sp.]
MRVELDISKDILDGEEKVIIKANRMTQLIQKIILLIEQHEKLDKLVGKNNGNIYPLEADEVYRFFTANKLLYAQTSTAEFVVDARLYQLEEILTNDFMRISHSEIINLKMIEHFRLSGNGLIEIHLKNGVVSYSSRSYLGKIKERIGL